MNTKQIYEEFYYKMDLIIDVYTKGLFKFVPRLTRDLRGDTQAQASLLKHLLEIEKELK